MGLLDNPTRIEENLHMHDSCGEGYVTDMTVLFESMTDLKENLPQYVKEQWQMKGFRTNRGRDICLQQLNKIGKELKLTRAGFDAFDYCTKHPNGNEVSRQILFYDLS